jgi:stage V sporulation protein AE
MEIFLTYLKVFAIGGAFCGLAQLILIKTKITSARILVIFLLAGIFLEAVGVFPYIRDFGKAGATTPIIGFGALLAKGAIEGAKAEGLLGALGGAMKIAAIGLGATIVFSYFAALIAKPKSK